MAKVLHGDVSDKHAADFLFIKGAFGCKNTGEVFEIIIDRVTSTIKKEVASPKGVKRP